MHLQKVFVYALGEKENRARITTQAFRITSDQGSDFTTFLGSGKRKEVYLFTTLSRD